MLDVILWAKIGRGMLWQEYTGHAPTLDLCTGCYLCLDWFLTPPQGMDPHLFGSLFKYLLYETFSNYFFLIAIPSTLSFPPIHTRNPHHLSCIFFHQRTYHHLKYYIVFSFLTVYPLILKYNSLSARIFLLFTFFSLQCWILNIKQWY